MILNVNHGLYSFSNFHMNNIASELIKWVSFFDNKNLCIVDDDHKYFSYHKVQVILSTYIDTIKKRLMVN